MVANVDWLEFHRCHADCQKVIVAVFCTFRHVRKICEKLPFSFVMFVCLSVSQSLCSSDRPHGTTRLPQDGFFFTEFDLRVFFESL